MTIFRVCVIAPVQQLIVDLPFEIRDELMVEASRAKLFVSHMTTADEDRVCRSVMIATGWIQSCLRRIELHMPCMTTGYPSSKQPSTSIKASFDAFVAIWML